MKAVNPIKAWEAWAGVGFLYLFAGYLILIAPVTEGLSVGVIMGAGVGVIAAWMTLLMIIQTATRPRGDE